jgi:tetratricopeptide (TPR) repeat protein
VGQLNAANYFGVQTEIANALFERLRHHVTPDERLRLAHVPTESLEAHRRSAEARMHLDQRSAESMQNALQYFEEAVLLDPEYAVARVGIADTLGLMHAYGYAGPEVLPRAEHAIQVALETDPFCAEAHAAHGRLLGQLKRETEARQALRQATALKPGYAEAHNWLTVGYQVSGNIEAAFDSSRRAVALNPLSAEVAGNFASTLLYQGRWQEALREARRALQMEPGYATATFFAALAQHASGHFGECLESLQGLELPWVGAGVDTVRALAHAGLQDLDATRERLSVIRSSGHTFDQGLVLAALGEKEDAFDAWGRTRFDGIDFATGYWPTVCVRYLFGAIWETLRSDARYAALVQRIDTSWGLA